MAVKIKRIKNRKNVSINQRNRKYNLYYISAIRTLSKKLKRMSTDYLMVEKENSGFLELEMRSVFQLLESKIDKAVKKKVLHRNTAAKRKAQISKFLKTKSIKLFV